MAPSRPDPFDPYREALVLERRTIVSPDVVRETGLTEAERTALTASLEADAASAAHLRYRRLPTGFCRDILVTTDDVARFRAIPSPPGRAEGSG